MESKGPKEAERSRQASRDRTPAPESITERSGKASFGEESGRNTRATHQRGQSTLLPGYLQRFAPIQVARWCTSADGSDAVQCGALVRCIVPQGEFAHPGLQIEKQWPEQGRENRAPAQRLAHVR